MATKKTAQVSAQSNQVQPKAPQGADKKPALRDQFGFGLETQNNKFGEMLQRDGGCTMREVREAQWNTKGSTFYNTFNALVKKGLAEKHDGRMSAVVKAKPGGN